MPRSSRARLVLLALSLTLAWSAAAADTLVIQGSTTFSRRLMEPFKPEIEAKSGHELTVIPNKSMPGLIALLEGRAHLAMISAPLEAEIAQLQKSMAGLQFDTLRAFEVSRTRVAITVHKNNPVRKTTLDQITQILEGKIINWKTLAGPDLTIRVILVGGGGGVTTVVEGALLNGQQTSAPNKVYVRSPVQLVQVVEQERAAIGFAQLALAKQRELVELTTDKPIEQVLYFVALGEPTPAMVSVINATRAVADRNM